MSSFVLNDVPHKTQNSGGFQWGGWFSKEKVEVNAILTEFWNKVLQES